MENKKRTAFILAAGLGTRLGKLTADKPKALAKVNGKPMLEHNVESLISQGFNHIVVNIHHFGNQIIDFFNEHNYDIKIDISDERELLMDTGGAITKALPFFKDSEAVLIHNVDVFTNVCLRNIYDDFLKSADAVWLLTQHRDNNRRLTFDNQGNLLGKINLETSEYQGVVPYDKSHEQLAFSGLHLIKPQYFYRFEAKPCYVFDLYFKLAEKQLVKRHNINPSHWFDLGTEKQIEEASSWLLSHK